MEFGYCTKCGSPLVDGKCPICDDEPQIIVHSSKDEGAKESQTKKEKHDFDDEDYGFGFLSNSSKDDDEIYSLNSSSSSSKSKVDFKEIVKKPAFKISIIIFAVLLVAAIVVALLFNFGVLGSKGFEDEYAPISTTYNTYDYTTYYTTAERVEDETEEELTTSLSWQNAPSNSLYRPSIEYYLTSQYRRYAYCTDSDVQNYVNMRYGPSKQQFDTTGTRLSNNSQVVVETQSINGYTLCKYNGQEGWIRSDFLFSFEHTTQAETATYETTSTTDYYGDDDDVYDPYDDDQEEDYDDEYTPSHKYEGFENGWWDSNSEMAFDDNSEDLLEDLNLISNEWIEVNLDYDFALDTIVHEEPNVDSEEIDTLDTGNMIIIRGIIGDWVCIEVEGSSYDIGWCQLK